MPLWNGDLLADTLDLDAAEVGAYILLIIAQWQRKGASLPDDENRLQRIARCGRNWPKVWARIGEYFVKDDAGYFVPKCRELSQNVAAKSTVNAQNGGRGGRAKALKMLSPPIANATESLERNGLRKATIPEPEKKKEREAEASPKKNAHGVRLAEGWFLPQSWGIWAVEAGMSIEEAHRQAVIFADYWHSVAGAKARKVDWLATWRNWVRKALDDQKGRQNDQRSRFHDAGPTAQGGQRPNAAITNIARLAGLEGSPGDVGAGIGSAGDEDGSLWLGEGTWEPDPGPLDH